MNIFPAGTDYLTALVFVTARQATLGRSVDPGTAVLLTDYYVRGTADVLPDGAGRDFDDHGWRDVTAQTANVVLKYRVSGPGVHNP